MTIPDDQPAPGRRRVRPSAMTGWRTRPTHTDLEIEALVATTAIGQQTPKLTVEQRDIAALCHDILSIAEISARLHLPLGVIRVLVGDMADERLVMVHRPAQAGDRPDLARWSGCCTGCTPSDERLLKSPAADPRRVESSGRCWRRKGWLTTEIAQSHAPPIGRHDITTSAQARGGQRSSSAAT